MCMVPRLGDPALPLLNYLSVPAMNGYAGWAVVTSARNRPSASLNSDGVSQYIECGAPVTISGPGPGEQLARPADGARAEHGVLLTRQQQQREGCGVEFFQAGTVGAEVPQVLPSWPC